MLIDNQLDTKAKGGETDTLDIEIDKILSDLADIVIDDYLNRVATRCYTEIKSISKYDTE